jgi:hypothetical protein
LIRVNARPAQQLENTSGSANADQPGIQAGSRFQIVEEGILSKGNDCNLIDWNAFFAIGTICRFARMIAYPTHDQVPFSPALRLSLGS